LLINSIRERSDLSPSFLNSRIGDSLSKLA
jgi:hypothetical protein